MTLETLFSAVNMTALAGWLLLVLLAIAYGALRPATYASRTRWG